MIVETSRFGKIEIEEKNIIEMVNGILGFESFKKYILLDYDGEIPFKWLQSVDDGDLAFVVMEPFIFYQGYQFDLSDNDVRDLGLAKPEEVAVLTILTVPEDYKKMCANIKAPIIINQTNKKAKQIVLNNEAYSIKHYLFQEGK